MARNPTAHQPQHTQAIEPAQVSLCRHPRNLPLDRQSVVGPQPRRSNGFCRSRPFAVPLTVLAELLGRSTAAPYKSVPLYGMRNWILAALRQDLTKGAEYANELDVERTIRFNASVLEARAGLVLNRRAEHRATKLDGQALALSLGVDGLPADATFGQVWQAVIDCVVQELLDALNWGHVEDVRWAVAERYLDKTVVPRVKGLAASGAAPGVPVVPSEHYDLPLSMVGGLKRLRRVLDGLVSKDPQVVAAMLNSWEVRRLLGDKAACGDVDWGRAMFEI